MPVKVGMNGFGRIGRYLLRLMADNQDIQIAAINARADNAALAYLFKYDSTYGTFQGTVDHDENGIIVETNRAWQEFARANGMPEPVDCVGCNYLHICEIRKHYFYLV